MEQAKYTPQVMLSVNYNRTPELKAHLVSKLKDVDRINKIYRMDVGAVFEREMKDDEFTQKISVIETSLTNSEFHSHDLRK